MKKTLIALAAVASLATSGAAFAQATISGGFGFASIKNMAGTSQGLLNTGAWLDVSTSEDLGGGMKIAGFMELNMDSSRAAAGSAYSGDRSLTLSTPSATFILTNTRSGGNQHASLLAPVNVWDDVWNGAVITRANVDAGVIVVPLSSSVSFVGKYVESGPDYAASAGTTTMVAGATYKGNGLSVAGYVNQSAFTPATAATLAGLGVTTPRTVSTDLSVVYDAGVAKVGFGYDSARRGKQDGTDDAAITGSVTVPFGAAEAGVNFGKRGNASFSQVGMQYNLSKRSNINLSFGNYDSGAANGQTNEYSLSLNHYF
jgi:hypothetical protein